MAATHEEVVRGINILLLALALALYHCPWLLADLRSEVISGRMISQSACKSKLPWNEIGLQKSIRKFESPWATDTELLNMWTWLLHEADNATDACGSSKLPGFVKAMLAWACLSPEERSCATEPMGCLEWSSDGVGTLSCQRCVHQTNSMTSHRSIFNRRMIDIERDVHLSMVLTWILVSGRVAVLTMTVSNMMAQPYV